MIISELIEKLEQVKKDRGDLPVQLTIQDHEHDTLYGITVSLYDLSAPFVLSGPVGPAVCLDAVRPGWQIRRTL